MGGTTDDPTASYLSTILSGIDKKLNAAKTKGSPEEVEMARAELDKFIKELASLPSIEEHLKKEQRDGRSKDLLIEKAKKMLKKESSVPYYLAAPAKIVNNIVSFIMKFLAKFLRWLEQMILGKK